VYLLKNNIELVKEIKKSVFYTLVIKTETVADFELKLTEIKKRYPGATHFVYAYKINQNFEYNKKLNQNTQINGKSKRSDNKK